jgi:hypothetical protein
MKVDPYLSLLVGALGAAVLGLFGAWVQSRREHSKWLREKRYEAYLTFLLLNDKHTTRSQLGENPQNDKEIAVAIEPINAAVSALSLLGPESVLDAARNFRDSAAAYIESGKAPNGYLEARKGYIVASRKAIKVKAEDDGRTGTSPL